MKKELLITLCALTSFAGSSATAVEPDKCAACKLVTKAEMQAVMGELKGDAKCDTGIRPGEVTCNYDNMEGSWVKIYLYKQTADQWSLAKNLMNKIMPLPKLGDEALWNKAGTDVQVFIRKGEKTLEVDSSGGLKFAKPVAEKAFARLK
jgi:hypothetical protein